MSDSSVFIDSGAGDWRETPYEGVEWKKLHFDKESGRSAVLVKFRPGSAYGIHKHPAGEEYYVLDGSLEDGGRTRGPGSYVYHPPGSIHQPRSAAGCTVFITLPAPVEPLTDDECREHKGID